ncbi:hypothetical protein NBRC111894_2890 [Sporolactobacillus inulinus]|uniref:Uncharacterized protein n=1 Tax=Sporolactobacillus inulinus TaxID=2078 RepID=A0A4Y1ZDY0_9BACL|nr:hypothetical protein NBRC111894_2890 [Sporolactobacillus inulinus]
MRSTFQLEQLSFRVRFIHPQGTGGVSIRGQVFIYTTNNKFTI